MKEASVERCLAQAAQHRRMAERTDDPELRAKLLRIAESYEDVAAHIARLNQRRRPEPLPDGVEPSEP